MKRLLAVAVAILIPLLLEAATRTFIVSINIRAPILLILDENADPATVEEFLAQFSSPAVSFATLSFGSQAQEGAVVRIAEDSLIAVNEDNDQIEVVTFASPLPDSGNTQYIVGGYIAANGQSALGSYQGSATLQALFQ